MDLYLSSSLELILGSRKKNKFDFASTTAVRISWNFNRESFEASKRLILSL